MSDIRVDGASDGDKAESPAQLSAVEVGPTPSADAARWAAEVFESELVRVIRQRIFNICILDGIKRGMLELDWVQEEHFKGNEAIQAGLLTLHCLEWVEMTDSVRVGVGKAIFEYLGLSDSQGVALVGADGWERVKAAYADFFQPAPAPASPTEEEERTEVKTRGLSSRIRAWFGREERVVGSCSGKGAAQ